MGGEIDGVPGEVHEGLTSNDTVFGVSSNRHTNPGVGGALADGPGIQPGDLALLGDPHRSGYLLRTSDTKSASVPGCDDLEKRPARHPPRHPPPGGLPAISQLARADDHQMFCHRN